MDIGTFAVVETLPKKQIKQIKPNSGLRALIAESLVAFRLRDEEKSVRQEAVANLARSGLARHLKPLRQALLDETDEALKEEMQRLERLLTIQFGKTTQERVEAIEDVSDNLTLDTRANLNRIVATQIRLQSQTVDGANIARTIVPGSDDFSVEQAHELLIAADLAKPIPSADQRKQILIENIEDGKVDGFTIHSLDNVENRNAAYLSLVADGRAPFWSPG